MCRLHSPRHLQHVSTMLRGLEAACGLFPAHRAQLTCAGVPSCPPPFGIVSVAELCVLGEKKRVWCALAGRSLSSARCIVTLWVCFCDHLQRRAKVVPYAMREGKWRCSTREKGHLFFWAWGCSAEQNLRCFSRRFLMISNEILW